MAGRREAQRELRLLQLSIRPRVAKRRVGRQLRLGAVSLPADVVDLDDLDFCCAAAPRDASAWHDLRAEHQLNQPAALEQVPSRSAFRSRVTTEMSMSAIEAHSRAARRSAPGQRPLVGEHRLRVAECHRRAVQNGSAGWRATLVCTAPRPDRFLIVRNTSSSRSSLTRSM